MEKAVLLKKFKFNSHKLFIDLGLKGEQLWDDAFGVRDFGSPSMSSLKAMTIPTKLCRTTSNWVSKAYIAVSQAGVCLHTMAIMQPYLAYLLRDLDEGEGVGSGVRLMRLKSCVGPQTCLSGLLRRRPMPSAPPWQHWKLRRGIYGYTYLASRKRTSLPP